jgi:hypothetical protein
MSQREWWRDCPNKEPHAEHHWFDFIVGYHCEGIPVAAQSAASKETG